MAKVIFEDNKILVVEKPFGIPVQADITGDEDLLSLLKKYLKEKDKKPGNVFLGLVHRLDRPVGGVMVFAKNSKAAGRISAQIRNKDFKKKYLAVVEGNLEKAGTLTNHIRKNKTLKKAEVFDEAHFDSKEAKLRYKVLDKKENLSLVEIELITGKYHQIRSQFAHVNHPVVGDFKYGSKINLNEGNDIKEIALLSYEIGFQHPGTQKKVVFNAKLPDRYPWNLFKL